MPRPVTIRNGFKWTEVDNPQKSSFVQCILSPARTKNGRPITGLPYAPEGGMKYKELEKAIFY